jgi:MoaA/NifB/PqqE/SkfB family radical SAM enzyme
MCGHSSPSFTLPPQPDFPLEAIEHLLPILATTKTIWLSGYGEPLMHPQIFEIISQVKSVNQAGTVACNTNAALLSRKTIDNLIQSGLDLMHVSFDGYDNDFGHLEATRVINNLRNLRDRKRKLGVDCPRVRLVTVLMKNNVEQLKQIIDECIEAGIFSFAITPLRAVQGNPNFQNFWERDVYSNKNYILPFVREAIAYARSRGIEILLYFMDEDLTICRQRCPYPFIFFHISTKGDVFMCCDGRPANENIYQKDVWEIWNSDAYKKLRLMVDTEGYDRKCLECTVVQPDIRVKDLKRHFSLS